MRHLLLLQGEYYIEGNCCHHLLGFECGLRMKVKNLVF